MVGWYVEKYATAVPTLSNETETLGKSVKIAGTSLLCLVGWLLGWLAGWLAGWLVGWLVGWWVGWLVGWLVCREKGRSSGHSEQ